MLDLHPKYQVDERGKRVVILDEEEFENLLVWAEKHLRPATHDTFKHALGMAATAQPAPSDDQVRDELDEHRMVKYG